MDIQFLKEADKQLLQQTRIDLNQPWTAVLDELQERNVSLLDRIGTCQDKEQLWRLQYLQNKIESLCEEIDRHFSTGVSLDPPKANDPAAEKPEKREPSVPAAQKADEAAASAEVKESAPAAPVTPKSDDPDVSDKMKEAMSNYTTGQRSPTIDFRLDVSEKILEKYIGDGGDVVIPEGIEEIGPSAFSMESGVYSVQFPSSLKWIGEYAFYSCKNLRSIEIPRGGIGNGAFSSCANLQKVTIGANVTELGDRVFAECPRLETVTLQPGLTDIGESTFYKCTRLREVAFPRSVTRIGASAFSNCTRLKNVTLPPRMPTISSNLFYNCSDLESIVIPEGVEHIDSYAFSDCTGLRKITISSRRTVIGDYVFSNCDYGRLCICAPQYSPAQEYAEAAKDYGVRFQALQELASTLTTPLSSTGYSSSDSGSSGYSSPDYSAAGLQYPISGTSDPTSSDHSTSTDRTAYSSSPSAEGGSAKPARRKKRGFKKVFAVLAFIIIAVPIVMAVGNHQRNQHAQAGELLEAGSYDEAAASKDLGDYSNTEERSLEAKYQEAEALLEAGEKPAAAVAFGALGGYQDARARSFAIWDEIAVRETISAGNEHAAGLKSDGTVVAAGKNSDGRCDVESWTDIAAVSASAFHTVGLKTDGTVVAVGKNEYGTCDTEDWTDIVSIAASNSDTVGLKSDGTVVVAGYHQGTTDSWRDVVAISAGGNNIAGVKTDGTVVTGGYNSLNEEWTGITALSVNSYMLGLKVDGTVQVAKWGSYWSSEPENWADIIAVSVGGDHSVGLKSDGTVMAVGYGAGKELNDWNNIVAVSAGTHYTIGLKSDGTVVVDRPQKINMDEVWTNIKLPS